MTHSLPRLLWLALALLFSLSAQAATTCTPSPNATVIKNGAGGTILDAACNKWTVTGGVVSENGALAGFSANVTELAIVGGVIWQVNNSSPPQWYDWLGTTWGPPGGTTVSPLPVVVVTPPPSTGLTAAQQAAVTAVTNDLAKLTADANAAGDDLTKLETDTAAMKAAIGAQ